MFQSFHLALLEHQETGAGCFLESRHVWVLHLGAALVVSWFQATAERNGCKGLRSPRLACLDMWAPLANQKNRTSPLRAENGFLSTLASICISSLLRTRRMRTGPSPSTSSARSRSGTAAKPSSRRLQESWKSQTKAKLSLGSSGLSKPRRAGKAGKETGRGTYVPFQKAARWVGHGMCFSSIGKKMAPQRPGLQRQLPLRRLRPVRRALAPQPGPHLRLHVSHVRLDRHPQQKLRGSVHSDAHRLPGGEVQGFHAAQAPLVERHVLLQNAETGVCQSLFAFQLAQNPSGRCVLLHKHLLHERAVHAVHGSLHQHLRLMSSNTPRARNQYDTGPSPFLPSLTSNHPRGSGCLADSHRSP